MVPATGQVNRMTRSHMENGKFESCESARDAVGSLRRSDALPSAVAGHLRRCSECAAWAAESARIQHLLRSVRPQSPSDLKVRLQVAASRDAARRRAVLEHGYFRYWLNRARDSFDAVMRPLAIPTAGGFVSALLLFGMLAPGLAVRGVSSYSHDVPTALYTEVSVEGFYPLGIDDGHDVYVEVTVDEQGRVVAYDTPHAHLSKSPELRRNLENRLLFTQFKPATVLGQPTQAKIRLGYRSTSIDVRG